jgi:large subunit ribosomal protein L37Ae
MATKKVGSAGRFGAKYGKRIRAKVAEIEKVQKQKQKCPFCGKLKMKRLSKGIWQCRKCNKKITSNTYFLPQ